MTAVKWIDEGPGLSYGEWEHFSILIKWKESADFELYDYYIMEQGCGVLYFRQQFYDMQLPENNGKDLLRQVRNYAIQLLGSHLEMKFDNF